MKFLQAALIAAMATMLPLIPVSAAEDVVIVYDASGSMWGQIDGTSKIVIAREVMADLVKSWPEDTRLGLIAYGHRNAGDCNDIETLIKPGLVDRAEFIKTVNAIEPKGKTPISASLRQAAEVLSWRDTSGTVVLISDGLETCHGDPCAVARELAEKGVDFTAHVVGFDLDEQGNQALSCIAANTGGMFVPASNAAELQDALTQVRAAVQEDRPEAAPKPQPEAPVQIEIKVNAPQQVVRGSRFAVSWSESVDGSDVITIVPADSKQGARANHIRVGDKLEGSLTAPAETGLYEVRYVLDKDKRTLGSAPVEVIEAEVSINAPAEIAQGSKFDVSWSKSVHASDYITIVPADSKQGARANHIRVGDKLQGSLVGPAETGLYEVRYVLDEGQRTLAAAPVEVIESEVSINAPAEIGQGAKFEVTWSKSVHASDFITIVPADAKQGARANHIRVGNKLAGSLVAPAEPGSYEVRYVLEEGKRTLATAPVEVVESEVSISAPAEISQGAKLDVSWSKSVHGSDYITIVPADAKQGARANHIRVGNKLEGSLVAPADTGLYEVRYVLEEGKQTMASASVEVVAAEVSISGPKVVRAGTPVHATWSSVVHRSDYVTIVPAGAKEGARANHIRVGNKLEGDVKAPAETGLYELRYVLEEGKRTLASHDLEVVAADAAIDLGAGLKVPSRAAAGASITVSWSGGSDGADQRIAIAKMDQADFSWIEAHTVGAEKSQALRMPDEPGRYEVRFLDISARQVLGRAIVEVE